MDITMYEMRTFPLEKEPFFVNLYHKQHACLLVSMRVET